MRHYCAEWDQDRTSAPLRHHRTFAPHHLLIHAGYDPKAEYTNNSAGVAIGLRTERFAPSNSIAIRNPPPELQGRGLSIILRCGDVRLNLVATYFPPAPGAPKPHELARWKATVTTLHKWALSELTNTPSTTTPILMGDLNSGTHYRRALEGTLGEFPRRSMSLAGRLFTDSFRTRDFCFANSFFPLAPSFRSRDRAKYPDQCICQRSALYLLERAVVSRAAGARLQYSAHFEDHSLVFYTWQLQLPIFQTCELKEICSTDLLALGLQNGNG